MLRYGVIQGIGYPIRRLLTPEYLLADFSFMLWSAYPRWGKSWSFNVLVPGWRLLVNLVDNGAASLKWQAAKSNPQKNYFIAGSLQRTWQKTSAFLFLLCIDGCQPLNTFSVRIFRFLSRYHLGVQVWLRNSGVRLHREQRNQTSRFRGY